MFVPYIFLLVLAACSICECEDNNPPAEIQSTVAQLASMVTFNGVWQQFLASAPSSVFLVGRLMLIAHEKDFILEKIHTTELKYIQHPESFRATIVQVFHSVYWGFYGAYENMLGISSSMGIIPGAIRRTIAALNMDLSAEIKANIMEIELDEMLIVANESIRLAGQSTVRFAETLAVFQEVQTLFVAEQTHRTGSYQNNMRQKQMIEVRMNLTRTRLQRYQKEEERISKEYASVVKQYDKAMDEISSSWELFVQEFVYKLLDVVTAIIPSGITMPTKIFQLATSAVELTEETIETVKKSSISGPQKITLGMGNLMTEHLHVMLGGVQVLLKGTKAPEKTVKNITEALISLRAIHRMGSEANSIVMLDEIKEQRKFIARAIDIMDSSKLLNFTIAPSVLGSLYTDIGEQLVFANKLHTMSTIAGVNSEQQEYDVSDTTTGNDRGRNERFKAQMALKRVIQVNRRRERIIEVIMATQREFVEFGLKIRSIDLDQIDIQDCIQLLKASMTYLSQLSTQWDLIMKFFVHFYTMVRTEFRSKVRLFRKYGANVAGGAPIVLLKQRAIGLLDWSGILAEITTNYVNVHNKYIRPNLANLNNMYSIETDDMRQQMWHELNATQTRVEDEIRRTMMAKNEVFQKQLGSVKDMIEVWLNKTEITNYNTYDVNAVAQLDNQTPNVLSGTTEDI